MATPTVIQFASQDTNGGGGSNTTLTIGWNTSNLIVGNRILSLTGWNDVVSAVTSCTDAISDPFSGPATFTSGTGSGNSNSFAGFISSPLTVANTQPAVTLHAGVTTPKNWEAWNFEINGADANNPIGNFAFNSAASGTSPTCTISTTNPNTLLISYAIATGSITAGPGGIWSDFSGSPTVDAYWMAKTNATSIGTYTATFTGDDSAWGVVIIAIQSTSNSFIVKPTDAIFYGMI